MLILEDILEKMKVHFPRWMDIRRKVKSSNGGLYLTAIGESIADIQTAINDYKKDFFIDSYFGKEDEIIAFLYKVPIGVVADTAALALITPEYTITIDEDVFYNNDKYVYYNDGNLYFKNDEATILYSIDNYKSEGTAEKIHVWNIFDEFAIFIGLKRYQWETNKELLNRIISFAKVKVNSTDDGLKNAILANLVNISPELKLEDISIERPTAENLVKYYDEFETILDHLMGVNRDVYKTKQWDIDTWNFGLKSVDYIPHAWDVFLSEYINGVGFKDDLSVSIIGKDQTTDVTIYFYKKQLEMINDYIKNNNIREPFKLKLTKYNEVINSRNVKYRITASDANKINTNNISFKALEQKTGEFNINIQDVIAPDHDASDITETDHSLLDASYNYVIDFIPTVEIGNFQIGYCKQGIINLLDKNYPGFVSNGDGLISTVSSKYINNIYQLESNKNITRTLQGFEIADLSKESSLSVDVSGCGGKTLLYEYDYKETILDLSNFSKTNCYISNNAIISDTVTEAKSVNIKLIANTFSCRIEGPYKITYSIDGGADKVIEDIKSYVYDFNIGKSDSPRELTLTIEFPNSGAKLKNTMYSKYDFKIATAEDSLVSSGNLIYLPLVDINTLNITMKSYAGFSPVLKYIYVGNKLTAANGYYGIAFNTDNGIKLNTQFENCRLQLKKFDKSGTLIETIYDYKPFMEYEARENVSVELDLSEYTVSSTTVEYGNITINNLNPVAKKYILNIPKGRSLISFKLFGTSNRPIVDTTLSVILEKKGIQYANYDFYIAKNENSIVAKNVVSGAISYIEILKEDLFDNLSTSTITVESSDNNILPKFIQSGNLAVYATSNVGDFISIAFEPTQGSVYTAINEYNVLLPYTKNVSIVNTFNNSFNALSTNPTLYTLESLSNDFNVRFETNAIFELCAVKTLDNTKISIKAKVVSDMEYNSDTIIAKSEFLLGSTIEIPQSIETDSGALVDVRKFVLSMDYTINYLNKYTDLDNYLDYIFTEIVYINSSRVTKLNYSNIYEIESVSYSNGQLKENLDYSILKDQGIVVWLNDAIPDDSEVYITYNINVAKSFNIDLDNLYTQIQYPTNSLELLSTAFVTTIKAGEKINLNSYEDYDKSDLISFNFSTAGFMSDMDNGVLSLINNTPENSIAIKTGYYYMDGREFYLLAEEKSDNINKIDSVNYHNVTKDNNTLILKQKSQNFIANSKFDLDTKGEIFDLNCLDKEIEGISDLNEISICDTFNYWTSFASTLSIVPGFNGQGLKFESLYETEGYCYLPLSKFITDDKNFVVSFYLSGGRALLGKEKTIDSETIEFNYQSLIEIVDVIEAGGVLDNVYEKTFTNKAGENYYLVLTGTGIVDDILLVEESKYDAYNHVKNLDLLNLNFDENIYTNYATRLYTTDKNCGILDGTEINDEQVIINSSYIHWGYTKIKSLNTYADFNKCILNNVDLLQFDSKATVKTGSTPGSITTYAIYSGNKNIIKNLLYKINDVMFEDMKGIKVKLLTSNSQNADFKEVMVSSENINAVSGINLSTYVKVMVELPANKVINNIEIFIEYLSNENNAPSEMEVSNGSYTSKVLDAQYNERYQIKNIDIESNSLELSNYIFQIRASKQNNEKTVWTEWKTIELDDKKDITNKIVFTDYRYFQFRVLLKGENASIKINHIDLEVI